MLHRGLQEEIEKIVTTPVKWDCPLAQYTSFGIGGPAKGVVKIENRNELHSLLKFCGTRGVLWRFIGRGTNLLVADEGFPGLVVTFGGSFRKIELVEARSDSSVLVRVDGGCSIAGLLKWCASKGYSGLEFTSGIPGTVGGAVVMNAGAWGGEIADRIECVEVFSIADGEKKIPRAGLEFIYRKWNNNKDSVGENRLVIAVDFLLTMVQSEVVSSRCLEYDLFRKDKQPKGVKNAGSFFKNPPGDSAGRLIEQAGLKGMKIGDAMISPVHANFLVNTGAASAGDVKALMDIVVEKVIKDSGVKLEPEVHFL